MQVEPLALNSTALAWPHPIPTTHVLLSHVQEPGVPFLRASAIWVTMAGSVQETPTGSFDPLMVARVKVCVLVFNCARKVVQLSYCGDPAKYVAPDVNVSE
jgi:hypothetical protein